jgi:hypothetical protein
MFYLLLSLRMCHILLLLSPLEQLIRCSRRLHRSPDYYSSSSFTSTVFSELASYRDDILHPE